MANPSGSNISGSLQAQIVGSNPSRSIDKYKSSIVYPVKADILRITALQLSKTDLQRH
jgi:hypothetical protein